MVLNRNLYTTFHYLLHISGKYTLSLSVLFPICSTPPPSAAAYKAGPEGTLAEDEPVVADTAPPCLDSESTANSVGTTSDSPYVLL